MLNQFAQALTRMFYEITEDTHKRFYNTFNVVEMPKVDTNSEAGLSIKHVIQKFPLNETITVTEKDTRVAANIICDGTQQLVDFNEFDKGIFKYKCEFRDVTETYYHPKSWSEILPNIQLGNVVPNIGERASQLGERCSHWYQWATESTKEISTSTFDSVMSYLGLVEPEPVIQPRCEFEDLSCHLERVQDQLESCDTAESWLKCYANTLIEYAKDYQEDALEWLSQNQGTVLAYASLGVGALALTTAAIRYSRASGQEPSSSPDESSDIAGRKLTRG